MNSWAKISLLVVIALVVISDVAGGRGGKGGKGGKKNWKCKGEKVQFDKMKDVMTECKEEAGDVEDKKVMMRKIQVCIYEKEGAVVDNKVSEEGVKGMVTKLFPENGEALGNFLVENCVTNKPSNVENLSKDDDAASYGPLVKCMFMKMHEYCEDE